MITVRLQGGLGNQLFQYAFGYALAKNLQSALQLDLSFLQRGIENEEFTPRPYSLDVYPIAAGTVALNSFARYYYPLTAGAKIRMHLNRLRGRPSFVTFNEGNMLPVQRLPKTDLYFEGYWQNEAFFDGYSGEIRAQIVPLGCRSEAFQQYEDALSQCENPVNIHIRRGDYVEVEAYRKKYGTTTPDYYRRAMTYIRAQVHAPCFYFFSDDPEWVGGHFASDEGYIVRGLEPHEDLHLMRQCRHHIIANSSFSWWGAWLGEQPDSITIAPAQWFADPGECKRKSHIVPQRWIRM